MSDNNISYELQQIRQILERIANATPVAPDVNVTVEGSGGVSDGDKGDITVASGVWTMNNVANPSWLTALAWSKLTSVPSTFAPSSHTHPLSELTASGASINDVATFDGTNWVPAAPSGSGVNVQRFTTVGAYTWTNPSPSTPRLVHFYIRGGTGGGGSGRKGAAGTVRCGGGGGAAGGVYEGFCWSTDLPASVSVTVGSGGAGGAGVTADDTNGNAGANGAVSAFGIYYGALGNGGSGGTNASGAGGFPTGQGSTIFGAVAFTAPFGGAASVTGGAGSAGQSTNYIIPTGGGAGGGITSADVASAGGTGGARGNPYYSYSVGGYGGLHVFNPSINGIAGAAPGPTVPGRDGLGGGGGAGALTGVAGRGGNGSAPGGGGGGGGAGTNGVGNASGAGGTGADGRVDITTFL